MDLRAFDKIPCGLYIVSAPNGAHGVGCVVNTFGQVTAVPICVTVSVHKDNCTTDAIQKAGVFACTALAENAPMELIGLFGFQSGREVDKFSQLAPADKSTDENGVPYVCGYASARFACKVKKTVDIGTHMLFFAEVTHSEMLSDTPTLTYDDYHFIKKGLTPPKAASYRVPEDVIEAAPTAKAWRCKICGYIYEGEFLPEDYICPICKKGANVFEPMF
jgi:flavin reductase (DIM6/NTAB) family NADH-FMN oxidoreductase RutF/rubredoxin